MRFVLWVIDGKMGGVECRGLGTISFNLSWVPFLLFVFRIGSCFYSKYTILLMIT